MPGELHQKTYIDNFTALNRFHDGIFKRFSHGFQPNVPVSLLADSNLRGFAFVDEVLSGSCSTKRIAFARAAFPFLVVYELTLFVTSAIHNCFGDQIRN